MASRKMGQLLRGGGGGGRPGADSVEYKLPGLSAGSSCSFGPQSRDGPTTLVSETRVEKRLCALVQDEKQAIRHNEVVARLRGAPCQASEGPSVCVMIGAIPLDNLQVLEDPRKLCLCGLLLSAFILLGMNTEI